MATRDLRHYRPPSLVTVPDADTGWREKGGAGLYVVGGGGGGGRLHWEMVMEVGRRLFVYVYVGGERHRHEGSSRYGI